MAAAKNPVRGEKHYRAKLTADDVRLIRECVQERERILAEARKFSNAALAEKFNVQPVTIENVANFRRWVHV